MTTVVEHEEEKYEVGDMEDVIEDLGVEKHVEVAEATAEFEDAFKLRQGMTHSDGTVDQFETMIGKNLVEDEDLDVKEVVKHKEGAPQSANRLEVIRTTVKPEAVTENGSQYGTIDDHIENIIEKEPVANLDINADVVEQLQRTPESKDRLEISQSLLRHEAEEDHSARQALCNTESFTPERSQINVLIVVRAIWTGIREYIRARDRMNIHGCVMLF
ncbi:unnamed protein product [Cyprideis torosa]|uniref:Uncharacterized protein n=1 Tax=Cyprideis torosa TaxID=163714 RepID=A0A7R8WH07_9CRUS|nr:unnamed protein product [Cyprideis torosa]CAG0893249.1 unnamed protein product [Cyprideis torosa]